MMKMQKKHVLIFPAGAENALEVYDALKYNLHIEVFGASGKPDYARYAYPSNHYFEGALYINEPNFIENFNRVLERFSIDYVIPTHDTIALYLKEHENEFLAEVIGSPYETTVVARSKKKIYDYLKEYPWIPGYTTDPEEIKSFPVFFKPDIGEGAKGTKQITTKKEALEASVEVSNGMFCEYLPGKEYTIDCFTNRERKLIYAGVRTRERVLMGISFCSRGVALTGEIRNIAERLNQTFTFQGYWFFQLKESAEGALKLMEFSVRPAGTMALYRQIGINFSLLSIFDRMGFDVSILEQPYEIELERRLTNCYHINWQYDTVYIDLDDTLIVREKVNAILMQLMYQWSNEGKKIILLTKHNKNPKDTLLKYKIAESLFHEIIQLSDSDRKVNYIKDEKAVFIDNYFPERREVHEVCGIPVFDVDAIECLLHRDYIG